MTEITIGIRREDRYEWEKRTPIVPDDVTKLVNNEGIRVIVQPSSKRVFRDEEYEDAGAILSESLSEAKVIFGLKEIPLESIIDHKVYAIFSHTIKGQKHNMPMLKRFVDGHVTLIDYEKITDDKGLRLIFFGHHAGIAGMIDTLWTLGRRLEYEGIHTPFNEIKRAYEYHNIVEIKEHLRVIGKHIKKNGIPQELAPLIIGIAGYGHVSRGAQEILDALEPKVIEPEDIKHVFEKDDNKAIYKVIFKEIHTVVPKDPNHKFDLQEYFEHPYKYKGIFEKYLPYLTVLVNAIYWDQRAPRLVSKETIRKLWIKGEKRLKVIGDISCDIEGGIEITVKATDPINPVYVYEPLTSKIRDGVEGDGPVIMAIDILPSEIPRDASIHFSKNLMPYIPAIAKANYSGKIEDSNLPHEIKRAVILWKGEFTTPYKYMEQFLK